MEISLENFLKLNLKDETFIIETDTVYGIGGFNIQAAQYTGPIKEPRPASSHPAIYLYPSFKSLFS